MNILLKTILLFKCISLFPAVYSKDFTPELKQSFPNLFEELETDKGYPHIQTVRYSHTPVWGTLFKGLNHKGWDRLYSTGLFKDHDILLEDYSEEPINVKVFLQKHKAPILYFFPGTLTSNKWPISLANIKYYHKLGFHVVSFSNPWTTDVLSKRLKNKMGDLESEAKLHWALIEELENHIIPKGIVNQRHILGKSYGALLATIVLGLSEKSGKTLDSIILISPPGSLSSGIREIDNLINNYRNFNINPLIVAGIVSRYNNKDFLVSSETTNNAKASIAQYVFLSNLSDQPLAEIKNITPLRKDELSVMNFVERYFPDSRQVIISEKGSLDYWLEQLRKVDLLNRVKLVISDNDPLSEKGYGKKVLKLFPEVTGAVLPGGAHNLFDNNLFHKLHEYILKMPLLY